MRKPPFYFFQPETCLFSGYYSFFAATPEQKALGLYPDRRATEKSPYFLMKYSAENGH